jgi:hypothetical protein
MARVTSLYHRYIERQQRRWRFRRPIVIESSRTPRTTAEGLFRPGDPAEIRDQIRHLLSLKYYVQRKTDFHIKIGDVNYYPHRGTITIDPSLRHAEKGFKALLALLETKRDMARFLKTL